MHVTNYRSNFFAPILVQKWGLVGSEWPVADEGRGFPPSVQDEAQKRSEQGKREEGREP